MPRRNIGKSFSAVDLYGKALSFQRVSPIFDAFSVDLVFFRLRSSLQGRIQDMPRRNIGRSCSRMGFYSKTHMFSTRASHG